MLLPSLTERLHQEKRRNKRKLKRERLNHKMKLPRELRKNKNQKRRKRRRRKRKELHHCSPRLNRLTRFCLLKIFLQKLQI
jgi:hypothetical protein